MVASDDRFILIKGLSYREKALATRRDSLNAEFGDDDDMEEEWNRLSMAENQVQRELSTCMKMVDIMLAVDEDDDGDGFCEDELRQSLHSMGSTRSMESGSTRSMGSVSYDGGQLSIQVEEEPTGRKKTFARGFFDFVKPKKNLEAQKKRQMELVQEYLSSLDPGLEDVMTCQNETQDLMIQQDLQEMEEIQGMLDDMNGHLRTSTNFRDSSILQEDLKPAEKGFFGFRQKKWKFKLPELPRPRLKT
jgi:hypothetical protein